MNKELLKQEITNILDAYSTKVEQLAHEDYRSPLRWNLISYKHQAAAKIMELIEKE